jgi:succinyl-CoA synthetase alpha subunit
LICLKKVLEQGTAEQEAAEYIREHVTKPVVGYVVGVSAPPGKTMGHAGTIISGGSGTAKERHRRWRVQGLWWQGVLRMWLGRYRN